MIAALLLGRKGSVGMPGKNLYEILGHPLAWYPMNAGLKAKGVDKVYLSTDDEELMQLAKENDVEVIERPDYLCTKEALGEDAYKHGYEEITRREGEEPEILVLLFCNAPTVLSDQIDEGIKVLRDNPEYDSAVTVSRFNMYSPVRARREKSDGLLAPFVALENLGVDNINCDRDCQGDVWFADCSLSVVRPRTLKDLENGAPPQKWMGHKIYPLKQEAGCDVDYEWQIPMVEWWLKKYLFKNL
ncbi:MAG: hypothetical protein NE327_04705 [Lentisphaeraceae bacterium]|nr:hypothetical protein [Lentisphaeraceae bacterium]